MKYFASLKSRIGVGLLLLLVVLVGIEGVVATLNIRRTTPIIGLRLHDAIISGLTAPQIAAVGEKELSRPLLLRFQDETFQILPQELDAHVDATRLLAKSYGTGHSGTLWNKWRDQTLALLGAYRLTLGGTISKTLLDSKVLSIASTINANPTPPMPDFTGDLARTLPPHQGITVDIQRLAALIQRNIFNPSNQYLEIPARATVSSHAEKELSGIREEALRLTARPLQISSAGEVFALTPGDLKGLLTVVERPDPQHASSTRLQLRLDDRALNRKLQEFAARVESKTHAEFDDHDARVAIYAQFFPNTRKTIEIPTGFVSDADRTPPLPAPSRPKQSQVPLRTPRYYLANMLSIAQGMEPFPRPEMPIASTTKVAYLTFDDGPNAVYHPLILDILKKYGVKATFFLVGENAKRYLAVTKRTVAEGHIIGNHSLSHSFLPKLPPQKLVKEIKSTTEILNTFVDVPIVLFRPPYGGINSRVKEEAKNDKLKLVLWNVDPQDWSEPAVDTLIDRIVSHVYDGADILLHSNHLITVKALPKIIEALQAEGYQFESL